MREANSRAVIEVVLLAYLFSPQASTADAQSSVTVPGTAAIWLAGQPDGTTIFGDVAPANSPVSIDLASLGGPSFVSFTVSGSTSRDPDLSTWPLVGADGEPRDFSDPFIITPVFPLSGMAGQFESLVGVFVNSSQTLRVPPSLDFGPPSSTSFSLLAPLLQQVFFIGDGLTGLGTGTRQLFQVPNGADRLYLGLFDRENNNNVGELQVTVDAASGGCADDFTSQIRITRGPILFEDSTQLFVQRVKLTNISSSVISGPAYLVLDNLGSRRTRLANQNGVTECAAPLGSPFRKVNLGLDDVLSPGEYGVVILRFRHPLPGAITYNPRVLAGDGPR